MNNILIDIKSKIDQFEGECHNIDIITEGEWFEKNGSIFIVYYESELSGMEGCKTMLKIHEKTITMTRFGETNSKIVFNTEEPMSSVYKTPYGNFDMSVFTELLELNLDSDSLTGDISIEYRMVLENLSRSKNEMHINIKAASND